MGEGPLEFAVTIPNQKEIEKRLGQMKDKAPQVMARAINRTLTHASSKITKEIKKTFTVDKKVKDEVKAASRVKRAKAGEPTGTVALSSSKRIELSHFKLNPKKPSPGSPPQYYQVQIETGGSMKNMETDKENSKGFLATMKGSGHTGMYVRKKGKQRKTGPRDRERFNGYQDDPIVQLYGPSVARMAAASKIPANVLQDGEEFLLKQLEHDIQYFKLQGK